jgi:drug/metabolite transporter (DMT)-like permease
LGTTTAATASLLLNFESVFTALLAWTVFRERWRWPIFCGILTITAGGMILSHTENARVGLSWGAVAILGTCFMWAMDSNFTNKVADRDPLQVALLKSGVSGLINVAIALALGQSLPGLLTLATVLSVGFFSSGLTLVCFVLALRQMGSARTGAYFALAPFVGALIAIIFLGEQMTQSLAIAAILMAIGAGLCAQEPS